MILKLYPLVSTLAAPFVLVGFSLWSIITGKKKRGLKDHFGVLPRLPRSKNKTVWAHALSLGEVNAAQPVLKELHALQPDWRIVVTVTTDSGYTAAQERIPFAQVIGFHPLDCWPFILLALRRIRPDVFVLFDTGFWPGFILSLQQRKVPAILLNGRISRRSKENYLKRSSLFGPLFQSFKMLAVQDEDAVSVLKSLGVPHEKTRVMGDPKFDALVEVPEGERSDLKNSLGISDAHLVMIAGSTHEGEEQVVLDAFELLKKSHPELILILAPRRLERAQEVAGLLESRNISFVRRSEGQTVSDGGAILLDTMGELARCYSIADIAFVGRSLIHPGGGHSLIEPAQFGIPVLTGPFVENQQEQARQLTEAGMAFTVTNAKQIADCAQSFLSDPTQRDHLQAKASDFMQRTQGASRGMAELIISNTSRDR